MASKAKDMAGKRFGGLTVIRRSVSEPTRVHGTSYKAVWTCLCKCGKVVDLPGTYLRQGAVRSCGCQKDVLIRAAQILRKHGSVSPMRFEVVGERDDGSG
jgi:hypothetical protein